MDQMRFLAGLGTGSAILLHFSPRLAEFVQSLNSIAVHSEDDVFVGHRSCDRLVLDPVRNTCAKTGDGQQPDQLSENADNCSLIRRPLDVTSRRWVLVFFTDCKKLIGEDR
jgi:hypothetical protein